MKAFEDAIAGFRKKFPQITVKLVKGVEDDQITQAVRGGTPPDVASSFTTDNVAQWCRSGVFQDLTPVIKQDGIDLSVLSAASRAYTEFEGKRCVMPLLADAYGLYYNKALMKGNAPPKTLSELTALAKKLTVRDADGTIKVAGFIPQLPVLRERRRAPRADGRRDLGEAGRHLGDRLRPRLEGAPAVAEGARRLVRLRQSGEVPQEPGPGVVGRPTRSTRARSPWPWTASGATP